MAKKKVTGNIVETGSTNYSFREVFTDDIGKQHFTIPHSDPHVYEDDYGWLFDSVEEAKKYLQEDIDNEIIGEEEVKDWFLVKIDYSVVK